MQGLQTLLCKILQFFFEEIAPSSEKWCIF